MKEIPLTKGLVALVDDDVYDRLPPGKWHSSSGYAVGCINGRNVRLHRLIMGVLDDPTILIDHKNGIRWDCQRHNLRIATRKQNAQNRVGNRIDKHKGVYWNKRIGKWMASLGVDDKSSYIGYFDDPDEAARHYNLKASQVYGEYARFNDVDPLFPENGLAKPCILKANNTSRFRGVTSYGKREKWRVQIMKDGKMKMMAGFPTPESAARAYDKVAIEMFGDRARLNFPEDITAQPLP